MASSIARLALTASFTMLVSAVPWISPVQTEAAEHGMYFGLGMGMSPKPTMGPMLGDMHRLFKRYGPTCGYVGGISSEPYYCIDDTAICAQNDYNHVLGCCQSADLTVDCYIPTSCIPATELTACDVSCFTNSYILKCASTGEQECATLISAPGQFAYTALFCHTTSQYGTIFYTYSGETLSPQATTSSPHFASQPTTIGQQPTGKVNATTTSNSASSTTSASSSGGGSSTPVGAIVGGVVGGLAVVAILIAVVVYMVLNRRKKAAAAADSAAGTTGPNGPSGGHGPDGSHFSPPANMYSGSAAAIAGTGGIVAEKDAAPALHEAPNTSVPYDNKTPGYNSYAPTSASSLTPGPHPSSLTTPGFSPTSAYTAPATSPSVRGELPGAGGAPKVPQQMYGAGEEPRYELGA